MIYTFEILDMHCTSCALSIDFDLEEMPGVSNSQTNYAKSQTIVNTVGNKIVPDQIINQIKKTGYKARLLNTQK